MSGEPKEGTRVISLAKARAAKGGGSSNHGRRIAALERDMTAVTQSLESVKTTLQKVEENTASIVALHTSARDVAGILAKYGPRLLTFGAGIFTAAGIGNPKIWESIAHFFGQ